MDLSTAADIAQVLSLATIVGGGALALIQQRNFHSQRLDQASFEFLQMWTPETFTLLERLYALPDPTTAAAVEKDPDVRTAASHLYTIIEKMGILVHDRHIPLSRVDEWAGGAITICWRKLKPWVEQVRKEAGSQRPGEWFQWLAERLEAYEPHRHQEPAHLRERDWRP